SFLLLKGLDHTLLWQDEGHTAVLAERILQFGYPKVWDGQNLITGMNGLDFNGAYALTWAGWLPYYLTAGSFALLGKRPFSALLHFVLIAILTLPLFYRFVLRLTKDKAISFWALCFMATSLTFLMHSRQCRYYSLLPFSMVLAYYGLLLLPRWKGVVLVTLGACLLYYSNVLSFALLLVSFLLIPLFFKVDGPRLKSFTLSLGLTFLMTLPMFIYSRIWEKEAGFQSAFDFYTYKTELFGNLIFLNKFYIALFLLALGFAFRRKWFDLFQNKIFLFALSLFGVFIFLIPFKFYANNRYLLPLLPLIGLILAMIHLGAWRRWKIVGALLFLLSFSTHAFSYLPVKAGIETLKAAYPFLPKRTQEILRQRYEHFQKFDDEEGPSAMKESYSVLYIPTFWDRFFPSEYRSFFNEIQNPFHDGLEEVVAFLKIHASPQDRVYLSVGQFPYLFYYPESHLAYTTSKPPPFSTAEPVDSSQWDEAEIDWFIPRYFRQPKGPHFTEDEFLKRAQERGWRLQKYVLNTPQILWEGNWPYWTRLYRIKQREFPILEREPTVVYRVIHEKEESETARLRR